MFNFVLSMWFNRKIDEAKVLSYVPRWITADEAESILATPQK